MNKYIKSSSRRAFLKQTSISGLGAMLTPSLVAGALEQYQRGPLSVEEEPIIDIHQHTNYTGRTHDELVTHQRAMGVSTTVLLPAGHPVSRGSTYYGVCNGLQAEVTPNEDAYRLAQQYPDDFIYAGNEVPDLPGATEEIEKYLKLGAPIIGESKFGVECDAPEMQQIYELARQYDVPVLLHFQYNMYNRGLERMHTMLEKYPDVKFIGHAQTWWANVDKNHTDQNVLYPDTKVTRGGITDQLLSSYPNMYGDLSAGSGQNSLLRDEEHGRGFLERHQDQLLFGSDCPDPVGHGEDCIGFNTIKAIRRLSPNKTVERKILYENAKRLLKF